MPEPRPLHIRAGHHDDPPSSSPRTRRAQLRRALHDTSDLAPHDPPTMPDADTSRIPRSTLLSPISRRRHRSPSSTAEERRGAPTAIDRVLQERRVKRRRLDAEGEGLSSVVKPIKYGHLGQVEPGRLRLDIISCDGGEHVDPRHPGLYLGVKNILQHDKSVYCSSRQSTNVILRHADDTPFCLEKLHIVGPEHGFTAPVAAGLVYVAMSLNDLQKYIEPPWARRGAPSHRENLLPFPTNYRITRRESQFLDDLRQSPERITLSDALRDEQVNAALHTAHHRARDYARVEDRLRGAAAATAEDWSSFYSDEVESSRRASEDVQQLHCDINGLPPHSSSNDPDVVISPDGEHVTPVTVLSDEDVGPESPTSQEVLDFRLQRLRLQGRRYERSQLNMVARYSQGSGRDRYPGPDRYSGIGESSSGPGSQGLRFMAGASAAEAREAELSAWYRQGREDGTPAWGPRLVGGVAVEGPQRSRAAVAASATFTSSSTAAEDERAGKRALELEGRDPNVTLARFEIRRGRHKVAIRFQPAVSGRFMLLKLWAGAGRGNVDVQSVVGKGYGGARFFPAVQRA
ncbi:hypothetical protein LTR53_001442 [Teratosphaeriaceae sp. CCFEE 6253]|nr:hypothetical protein LTR53_001442 [Teratosphaeriaceae sp. CCFEE 6253]